MVNNVQVPLIGQQDQAINNLRLTVAIQILGQLAAVDYADCFRMAVDKKSTFGDGSDQLELSLNTGMVGRSAVAYTDALLASLGIIRLE